MIAVLVIIIVAARGEWTSQSELAKSELVRDELQYNSDCLNPKTTATNHAECAKIQARIENQGVINEFGVLLKVLVGGFGSLVGFGITGLLFCIVIGGLFISYEYFTRQTLVLRSIRTISDGISEAIKQRWSSMKNTILKNQSISKILSSIVKN